VIEIRGNSVMDSGGASRPCEPLSSVSHDKRCDVEMKSLENFKAESMPRGSMRSEDT